MYEPVSHITEELLWLLNAAIYVSVSTVHCGTVMSHVKCLSIVTLSLQSRTVNIQYVYQVLPRTVRLV